MAARRIIPKPFISKKGVDYSLVKFHLGVDIGKSRHKACLHNLEKDSFSGIFSIDVTREGFEKLCNTLNKYSTNPEDFLIGLEATGSYGTTLAYYLLAKGYKVVEINPYQANKFRQAQGKKAKTDAIDARSLAAFIGIGQHKPLSIPDPAIDNLRELTRFRTELIQDRSSLINQLKQTLNTLYPEIGQVLASLDSPSCLDLLVACPGPSYILQAGESSLTDRLIKASHGKLGEEQAHELVEAAQKTIGLLIRQEALAIKVKILGERILGLNLAIEKVEKQVREIYHGLPNKPAGFPVGEEVSLATLVAEIEDIGRYATIKQFLSHLGWCPRVYQSGSFNMEHPPMSHAGNRYVRHLIWLLSIVAIRDVPEYRAYFQRRVASGKGKMDVLVAVGRKLLSAFYAILKSGNPYKPRQEVIPA